VRIEQDATVGSQEGASEGIMPGAKTQKIKGTTTFVLDFDESDDKVHDEEAEHDRASRLSESTINVNTGERVFYQLEKGVSTGDFILLLRIFLSYFYLLLIFISVFAEKFFPDSSSQRETTVDVGKMKEVA
jgi:hypothetical protein